MTEATVGADDQGVALAGLDARIAATALGARLGRYRLGLTAAVVLLTGAAVIVALASGLLVAGVAGRLVLRSSGIGRSHPVVAVAAAWLVIAGQVWLVARLHEPVRRRLGLATTATVAADHGRSTPPASAKRSPRRAVAETTGEWAVYVAVALLLLWPATANIAGVIAGSGDAEVYMWQGWRMSELLRQGVLIPTTIPDVVWPYGSNLLVSDGYLPTYIAALWNLIAAPVLAYNLALITAVMLNIAAGRHLAKTVSARRTVWMISAVAFATAPAIAMRIKGHFTLVFVFAIALIVAEALRTARDDRPVRWFRLGLLFFLAYLCSIYDLLFSAIAFAAIVLIAQREWRNALRQTLRITLAAVLCGLLMSPFLLSQLRLSSAEAAHNAAPVASSDAYLFSSDLIAIMATPKHDATLPLPTVANLYRRPPDNGLESTILPGYIVLAGLGVVCWLRSPLRRPLLSTLGVLWLLALGTSLRVAGLGVMVARDCVPSTGHICAQPWLPYQGLLEIPGLGSLRTPDRVSLTIAAVGVATLGLALDWLLGRVRGRGRAALIAAAAALLATSLVIPNPTAALGVAPSMQAALEAIASAPSGTDALLLVPADCTDVASEDVKLQYLHRRPAVGCQANFASIPWSSNLDLYAGSAGLAGLRCHPEIVGRRTTQFGPATTLTAGSLADVRSRLQVRYVLIDRAMLAAPGCDRLSGAVGLLEGHRVLASDDRWVLIDLAR